MTFSKLTCILLTIGLLGLNGEIRAQKKSDSSWNYSQKKKLPDSLFIIRYDTLLHLQSWISANQMEYRFKYDKDFQLVLAPNDINNLSFGFSYRFLELGLSFSPRFINAQNDEWEKGKSEKFTFGFGFAMHRFHLSVELTSVKGFYLKNIGDFYRSLPDTSHILFPDLRVGYFSTLLRYNTNPRFSTAALAGGTQFQKRTAWTILPTFQFASFSFRNEVDSSAVQAETTYSTDLNLLIPAMGTVALSPKFSFTMGLGPSIGVDFFKSVAINEDNKVVLTNGTGFTAGATFQTALSYNAKRFYSGFEYRYRAYGHKIEDVKRLSKQYSYFQIYFGWRMNAPGFAKRSLDWMNKVSPIKFE
jgi:uncharacterized protein DUF4421